MVEKDHVYLIQQLLQCLQPDQLRQLKEAFSQQPKQELSVDQFVSCVSGLLRSGYGVPKDAINKLNNVDNLLLLFRQVDTNDDGQITWDEISSCILETSDISVHSLHAFINRPTAEAWNGVEVEKVTYIPGWQKEVHCTAERTVNLYNTQNGQPYTKYEGHQGTVLAACYITSLQKLVTSAADRTIILWNKRSGQPAMQLETPVPQMSLAYVHNHAAADVRLSSPLLYSGGLDGVIHCWDLNGGKEIKGLFTSSGHHDWVTDLLVFSGGGCHMASASMDTTIRIWDLNLHECEYVKRGHAKGVLSLACCDTYRLLLSCGYGKEILVWNPFSTHGPVHRLKGHEKQPIGVRVVPGTAQAISCDISGKVVVWDLRTYSCVQTLADSGAKHNLAPTTAFYYDQEHNQVVTYGQQRVVWRALQAAESKTLPAHVRQVLYNAVFQLLVVVVDSNLYLYSTADGTLHHIYSQLSDCEITAATFTPSQRELLFCNLEGQAKVINLLNGTILQDFHVSSDEVRTVHHLQNDPRRFANQESTRLVLLVTQCSRILLLDYHKPQEEYVIGNVHATLHDFTLTAFSGRENLLALFSNAAMEVWLVGPSPSLKIRSKRVQPVLAAIFVDKQNCMVTAGMDGQLRVWCVPAFHVIIQCALQSMRPRHVAYCDSLKTLVVGDGTHLRTVDFEYLADMYFEAHLHAPWNYQQGDHGVLYHRRYHVVPAPQTVPQNGTVWAALDLKTHQRLSIHFISQEQRFLHIVRMAETMPEPDFVCRTTDHCAPCEAIPFYAVVTETFEKSLGEYLASNNNADNIPFIVECLVRGVQEIHAAGVVHCDVRIAQVVKAEDRWKWADLSHAALCGSQVTLSLHPPSCPPELAPLLANGNTVSVEAHPSLDMWGLGLVLLELVYGHRLFDGLESQDTLTALQSVDLEDRIRHLRLPDSPVKEVIHRVLALKPSHRWTIAKVVSYMEDTGYLTGFLVPSRNIRPFPRLTARSVDPIVVEQPMTLCENTFCGTSSPETLTEVRFTNIGSLVAVDIPPVLFTVDHIASESIIHVFDLQTQTCCGQVPADTEDGPKWMFPKLQAVMHCRGYARRPKTIQQVLNQMLTDADTVKAGHPSPHPSTPEHPLASIKDLGTSIADRSSPFFTECKRQGALQGDTWPQGRYQSIRPCNKSPQVEINRRPGPSLPLSFLSSLPVSEHFGTLNEVDGMADKPKGKPHRPRPTFPKVRSGSFSLPLHALDHTLFIGSPSKAATRRTAGIPGPSVSFPPPGRAADGSLPPLNSSSIRATPK